MSGRIVAEQALLGELLLSKAAIEHVVDVLRVDAFHHPAHRLIFDCVVDLYQRGEPADPVTVTIELGRRGDLFSVGGAAYLHTLVLLVPPFREVS